MSTMRGRRRYMSCALLTVLILTVTACSKGAEMQPTMTIGEAAAKVDEHIEQAMDQLSEGFTLAKSDTDDVMRCDDPTDGGPKGRVIASHAYLIEGHDPDKIPEYFDTLKTWWTSNGYRILDNEWENEYLWVENNDDAFRLSLKASPDGERFRIIASSPCVWPDGTPAPEE